MAAYEARNTGLVFPRLVADDPLTALLSSDWVWHDPFGDCSSVARNGLEIRAANARDLRFPNLSAPRLLRPVSGEFAAQTVCTPVSEQLPTMGGLLLWKDQENYLRLERGTGERNEISFRGRLLGRELVIGRGRLVADRLFLRLERRSEQINALCSRDGREWFTVGQVAFSLDDAVAVGLHAIGAIDRLVYPSAHPEGTAIRFERFSVWGCGERE
jgi:regulation of enolase protein 1 (concanavalin A-like superfamily)